MLSLKLSAYYVLNIGVKSNTVDLQGLHLVKRRFITPLPKLGELVYHHQEPVVDVLDRMYLTVTQTIMTDYCHQIIFCRPFSSFHLAEDIHKQKSSLCAQENLSEINF